ncbi:MAG: LEA type 2 family protein [Proteobacteria bacterium]|nr:LEA type 2 family protein [Pseudomonadota bacterium]MCP4919959.1 LEA type 2 family protein [Pseudomonadota bacterium]
MLLLLTGCAILKNLPDLGDLEDYTPVVSFKSLEIDDVDFDGADTRFVFQIKNPNPVSVALSSFRWDLALSGSSFLDGIDKDGFKLEADGKSDFEVPVSVVFSDLLDLRSDLGDKDFTEFTLAGDFGFDTPLGEVKIPYEHDGEFPVLKRPKAELIGLKLKDVSLLNQSAELNLKLDVTNQMAVDLDLQSLGYGVTLDGEKVVKGDTDKLGTLAAKESKRVRIPIEVDLLDLGKSLVSAITDKEPITVGLDGTVDVGTRWGTLPLTIDREKRLALE